MSDAETALHADRARAESFGSLAEDYDRFRPGYPAALIDDLVEDAPADALDVGCGTGKAATLLADRGVKMLGVEVDARMAGVARRHGIPVEVSTFEGWDSAGRRFDLIVSGQAWHWVDASIGIPKAKSLLRPAGLLCLFWNFPRFDDDTRAALDAVYRTAAPEIPQDSVARGLLPATARLHRGELVSAGFGVEHRRYHWTQVYSGEQWLGLVRTHSDHSALPPQTLQSLLDGLAAAIDALGGALHVRYVTEALLAGAA